MADEPVLTISSPVPPTPSAPAGVSPPTPKAPEEPKPAPSGDTGRVAELEAALSQLKQRDAQAEVDKALAAWVERRETQLIGGGWNEQAARDFARADGERAMEKWQRLQAVQERDSLYRLVVAQHFSREYDVPVDRLLSAQSPEAMEALAKNVKQEGARIKELEGRLARFEQGAVPTQKYDAGQGAVNMSDVEFERYASEYDGPWPETIRKRVQEIHSRR